MDNIISSLEAKVDRLLQETLNLEQRILAKNQAVYLILRDLVKSLDDDEGVPERTYTAIVDLMGHFLLPEKVDLFCNLVDATDGRFYLPQKEGVDEVVEQIFS